VYDQLRLPETFHPGFYKMTVSDYVHTDWTLRELREVEGEGGKSHFLAQILHKSHFPLFYDFPFPF